MLYPYFINTLYKVISTYLDLFELIFYVTGKSQNENFKQIYPYMPNNTFRMLLCGNSGSGKTNLLCHMLMSPLIYFDQLHLYAKNLEQDKFKNMMEKMN